MTKTQEKTLASLQARLTRKEEPEKHPRRKRIDGVIDTEKRTLESVINPVPMKNVRCDVSVEVYSRLLKLSYARKPWRKLHTYCEHVLTDHAFGALKYSPKTSKKKARKGA